MADYELQNEALKKELERLTKMDWAITRGEWPLVMEGFGNEATLVIDIVPMQNGQDSLLVYFAALDVPIEILAHKQVEDDLLHEKILEVLQERFQG